MARKQHVDVKPDETGMWRIVAPVSESLGGAPDKSYARVRDAEIAARRLVGARGGGEVVVHAPSGRVKDVLTVPPANRGQRTPWTRRARSRLKPF